MGSYFLLNAFAVIKVVLGTNFYDFAADDIDGNRISMSNYAGKVAVVVNVASKWGLAKYFYPQLQTIYEEQKINGLEILAFSCNQFFSQEPGTNAEIKEKILNTWGPTFQLMSKIEVNGADAHPIYKWMKSTEVGKGKEISWNFSTFIIDRCGHVRVRNEPYSRPNGWKAKLEEIIQEEITC